MSVAFGFEGAVIGTGAVGLAVAASLAKEDRSVVVREESDGCGTRNSRDAGLG
jgi:predicted NAD/FAD-dependent oxidoreductase